MVIKMIVSVEIKEMSMKISKSNVSVIYIFFIRVFFIRNEFIKLYVCFVECLLYFLVYGFRNLCLLCSCFIFNKGLFCCCNVWMKEDIEKLVFFLGNISSVVYVGFMWI